MFPDYEEEFEDNEELEEEEAVVRGKDVAFDYEKGDITLSDGSPALTEGKQALIQWIAKLLETEAKKYLIYEDYGVNTKEILFGDTPKLFKQAELQEDIEEKLLEHEKIYSVSEFEFTRSGINEVAKFEIETEYGTIEKEVAVNGTL